MGELACRTKIILDGGSAAGYAQALCNAAMSLNEGQVASLTDQVAYPIIKKLVIAEHALEEAHGMFLNAIGYDGPRP